ncbi:hypothetical protein C8R42DRAFT_729776 [Lentinula raphanica]|nr:hypothetical protein C8R42DRAFT_729776 [Lentinula raphanica]
MHFKSFSLSFRHNSDKRKTLSSNSNPSSPNSHSIPVEAPVLSHSPLPLNSIANIVLDPSNLDALYHTASSPNTTPNTPSSINSTTTAAPTSHHTSVSLSPNSEHASSLSPSIHHPRMSISDLVLNTTTLSALYDAREAERNVADTDVAESLSPGIESGRDDKTLSKQ